MSTRSATDAIVAPDSDSRLAVVVGGLLAPPGARLSVAELRAGRTADVVGILRCRPPSPR